MRIWKCIFSLILEENDLDQFISRDVPKPEGDEAKASHKRSMAKRIIADSIKDHLIPCVSSFKTLKEVYDSLTNMFEGKMFQGILQPVWTSLVPLPCMIQA